MDNFKIIIQKLEGFIRRYYTNELIKGGILFFSIGLLYFLLTLLVEHFLWLNQIARAILFWLFILVEVLLFVKFILIPISKLFKLQKGINYEEASKLIGNHFPEVNDKLLNVLQLHEDASQSELLLASINQKASELSPVPFKLAINLNQNVKYLRFAILPILLVLIFIAIGKVNWFTDSYKRVVDYKTAYEPPAPFQFFVLNDNLNGIENKDFKLIVNTAGSIIPEHAEITFNNETYFLQDKGSGLFEYVFTNVKDNISFQLQANGVQSKPYELSIIEVPTLLGFEMVLEYPKYIKKQNEILKSTGNAIVPEGTNVTWKLKTKATDRVHLFSTDTINFSKDKDRFQTTKQIISNLNYSLSTSNTNLTNYENLSYTIDVIKDQFPEFKIEMAQDSVDLKTLYFNGQVSDDYGLRALNLVYYETDNIETQVKLPITISKSNVDQFVTAFPNQVKLKEGVSYSLYFEVFDNDNLHNYKRTKSEVFTYREKTKSEEKNAQLAQQQNAINDFNKSLNTFDENEKLLEEISDTQKTKKNLNFNDKKQIQDVLKRQEQQEKLMKNFNKSFQDNLNEFDKENENDPLKKELQKRLKENEDQLKQDERLLDELQKLEEKISEEELSNKFKYLSKQNKKQKRSLEQLVELTKRFYVAKKMEKLQQDLERLADEQLELSEKSKAENTSDKQDKLNETFKDLQQELDALQKENEVLKKPMDLPREEQTESEINELQEDASDQLKKSESDENKNSENSEKQAKQKQKQSAQKMKQMSQSMQESMQTDGGEQMEEDAEMLRQILDNLLIFSFDEESLMNQFKSIEVNHNNYAKHLRKQHDLREYFEHVDDSLFSLSLRQPMLSEQVNNEITNIYHYMDLSLEEYSENLIYQGISSQQYVFSSANVLADLLSNILDNMEDQLNASSSSSGQGSGKQSGQSEGQLSDIIMSQEELNKQMQNQMNGKGEKEGEGDKQDGESSKPGESGSDGKEGEGNNSGEGNTSGEGKQPGNEELNGELFAIYQRQQELRNQLQERLEQEGLTPDSRQLLKQMEDVEMELLNDGFSKKTLEKMLNFEHQLLKLQDATFQQEQENKRESKSNSNSFSNTSSDKITQAKQYFNTTEILNRQVLPLQQSFKNKVQQYFNKL
ncbi:hypothetical protein [Formosa algae]|uniref:Glutamyl-tRNA synthetase n=1 Tax=Formosa algae TaxID=225843 RepID=A0A9X0YK06_9FLAO|nr:hypothetical protein [Formosa algae]MBP1838677.1 hypothetical protein [Formosa algae]MDQ0335177.1 hypothetical protein [Formosa algae]OEI80428.1 hypothetical protein AST99_09490 [Formosa algae]